MTDAPTPPQEPDEPQDASPDEPEESPAAEEQAEAAAAGGEAGEVEAAEGSDAVGEQAAEDVDHAAAMAAAMAEEGGDAAPAEAVGADSPAAFNLQQFSDGVEAEEPQGLDMLSDVDLDVTIELGRTRMLVEDVLRLGEGSVIELDRVAGDPVDIYVNERAVARGEVLVLNDNFCVRVNEIVSLDQSEESGAA